MEKLQDLRLLKLEGLSLSYIILMAPSSSGGRLARILGQQIPHRWLGQSSQRLLWLDLFQELQRLPFGSVCATWERADVCNQYEVRFHELFQYARTILPFEEEQIHYFMQGWRPQLRMGIHELVTSGRSFLDIVNHAHSLEHISRESQRGSDRWTTREGEFNGSQTGFWASRDRHPRRG